MVILVMILTMWPAVKVLRKKINENFLQNIGCV